MLGFCKEFLTEIGLSSWFGAFIYAICYILRLGLDSIRWIYVDQTRFDDLVTES